jgi:hypothetical protein
VAAVQLPRSVSCLAHGGHREAPRLPRRLPLRLPPGFSPSRGCHRGCH